MAEGTCSISDCGRPVVVKSRGWCGGHYARYRKHGSPTVGGPLRARGCGPTPCVVDGCNRARGSRLLGMCAKHALRYQTRGTTDDPVRNGTCSVEGCSRTESKHSGLCAVCLRRKERLGAVDSDRSTCSFPPCNRPAASENIGLCRGHYHQKWRGVELTPIYKRAERGAWARRDDVGRKHCSECGEWKPEGAFGSNPKYPDGLNCHCKVCRVARSYGITADQFNCMRSEQDFRCKICGAHESELARPLFVDHDHAHCRDDKGCPECVRGLLCGRCNAGIGFMDESPERLLSAVKYLREFQF